MRIFFLWLLCVSIAEAVPLPSYPLRYTLNTQGYGGTADGSTMLSQHGPLPPYVLGQQLWQNDGMVDAPNGAPGNFGDNITYWDASTIWQEYGRLYFGPWQEGPPGGGGKWHVSNISTCDVNGNGYTVSPPFIVQFGPVTYPPQPDCWASGWLTTKGLLDNPQTQNSGEIDVFEIFADIEAHTDVRAPGSNGNTGPKISGQDVYNLPYPSPSNPYGYFWTVWLDPASGVHIYVEDATWNGGHAGNMQDVWDGAYFPDWNQPWYIRVDFTRQQRDGNPNTPMGTMFLQGLQIYAP